MFLCFQSQEPQCSETWKPKKEAAFPWALPTTLHQTQNCLLHTKGEARKNPAESALSSLPHSTRAGLLFLCLPVGGAAVPSISSRDLPSLPRFSRVHRPKRLSPEFQSSVSHSSGSTVPTPSLLKM